MVVAPHWNQAVVGQPFGLTVPLSVALAAAMAQWRGAAGPSWTRGLAVALVVLGMMASCAALPWVLLGRYYTQ